MTTYVYENPKVLGGVGAEQMARRSRSHDGNWHPLTWISLMLDCNLYGPTPQDIIMTSMVLHAATAILLFLALGRMTGQLRALCGRRGSYLPSIRCARNRWPGSPSGRTCWAGVLFMLTLLAYATMPRRAFSLARYLTVVALLGLGLMGQADAGRGAAGCCCCWIIGRWARQTNRRSRSNPAGYRRIVLEKLRAPAVGGALRGWGCAQPARNAP